MANTSKKYWLYIIIVLIVIGLGISGYFLYQKYLSSNGKFSIVDRDNLPGKLFGPKGSQKAVNLDPDQIIYWTNKYRGDIGLPVLQKNILLTQAAQAKVKDMVDYQYFEHVSPSGVSPSELVKSIGYDYKVTGENLALGDFSDEKALVDAWMNSPGHRANILNTDYTEIGVYSGLETFEDRGKTWLSVQEFGKPLPDCPKPSANKQQEIDTSKTEINNIVSQINTLNSEISELNNQANQKIEQGNNIYTLTGDRSQAEVYWTEAENLRAEANEKSSQVLIKQKDLETLNSRAQTLTADYNAEVSVYNTCITQ